MFRSHFNLCQKQCQNQDECCSKKCTFQALEFIPNFINTDNHNPCNGLTHSFLLSVGNASEWKQPISDSCKFCFERVEKIPNEVDECNIPFHLYDIINCVYSENYERCPKFNPFKVEKCKLTKEYNDICCRI
jgi:hypothetical protein